MLTNGIIRFAPGGPTGDLERLDDFPASILSEVSFDEIRGRVVLPRQWLHRVTPVPQTWSGISVPRFAQERKRGAHLPSRAQPLEPLSWDLV